MADKATSRQHPIRAEPAGPPFLFVVQGQDKSIKPVTQLKLALKPRPWSFAEQNRSKIEAHWAGLKTANPDIWNGDILMAYDVELSGSVFSASFLNTDYASFIAWRDWARCAGDWPDREVYNCFGSAVIQSSDGALIYGSMQSNTLNAGLCYPPGGSLDLPDLLDDGRVDIEGSIRRELTEETGLDVADAVSAGLFAVFDEQRISIANLLKFSSSASEIVDQINTHISGADNPELSGTVVLRATGDLTKPMPGYARHLARHLLAD